MRNWRWFFGGGHDREGCASYSLMPTPLLYAGAQGKALFTDVDTDRTVPIDLLYVTDRGRCYRARRYRALYGRSFPPAVVRLDDCRIRQRYHVAYARGPKYGTAARRCDRTEAGENDGTRTLSAHSL